jgi:hypothetical protein
VCLVANGAEQKAPENPETNSLDITHDEKRQEKHRIHQFFSSLLDRNFRFSSQQPDTVHPFRGSTA